MVFLRRFSSPSAQPVLPEPVQPKVLVIAHDPVITWEDGRRMHQILGGYDPRRLADRYIEAVNYASYGYANYKIVEWRNIDHFPRFEDGFIYDMSSYLHRWRSGTGFHFPAQLDYQHLLKEFRILAHINLGRFDEVWLFGFPQAGYQPAVMIGPGAVNCPAPPLMEGIGRCQRRFIIMGFNYLEDIAAMLRTLGQRSTAILSYVYRRHRAQANLWQRFSRYDKIQAGQAECGSIEFAPNSDYANQFDNPRWIMSRCDDWYHYPHLRGETRPVNCQEWGGGDPGRHHLWWFRHLPHVAGRSGGIANNWWSYIVDPNQVK